MTLLTIEQLDIQFKGSDSPTVHSASLTIQKGKTTAIVGESGSGKSITAMSILKLHPSTHCPSGRIMFDGKNLIDLSENDIRSVRGKDIAMIFQEPMTALNPLHSIKKQISEILKLHHPDITSEGILGRVKELMTEVGLEHLNTRLGQYPHQLSGGERQRVMIAMAIANLPSLLIADEPTTALDVSTQVKIMALLGELQRKHDMSLLLISHDLHLVRSIAHHVVVMDKGKIVESADVDTLFSNPSHPYTKKLLAASHASEAVEVSSKKENLLTAHDLSVSYKVNKGFSLTGTVSKIVLYPMGLSLAKGHTLGIVGESGSGKTTMGLALARLISSTGNIVYNGQDISNISGKSLLNLRKDIQFVFQDPFSSLNPRMNIGQIVAEGLLVHQPTLSRDERTAKVIDILRDVGLEDSMIDRYPHEFSGGQRQRINIARAMILKPNCVIFDEPTSALDITLQTQIISLLKHMQKERNISYIFISHDIHSVKSISHDILVLKSGNVVEYGSASVVLENPTHEYTKSLIKASGI